MTLSGDRVPPEQAPDSVLSPTADFARTPVDQSPSAMPPVSIFEELAHADQMRLSAPQSVSNVSDEITKSLPAATHEPPIEPHISQSDSTDVSDWPIWQILDQEVPGSESLVDRLLLKPSARSHSTLQRNARQMLGYSSVALKIALNDRRFVRIAMAAAVLATLGLLFAATFQRFSPLPARLTKGSSLAAQPVPFQKVQATTFRNAHPAQDGIPSEAPAPQVQIRSANMLRASGQLTRAASNDAGLIAKDTVIRYGSRSDSAHIFSEPIQSGVKYYTDLSPTRQ